MLAWPDRELERVDGLDEVSGTPNDDVCAEADGRDCRLRLGEVRGAGGGQSPRRAPGMTPWMSAKPFMTRVR